MSKNTKTPATAATTVETKRARAEDRVGYVGARISQRQLKRMLVGCTPEARIVLKSIVLDNFKVRQDLKGTMDWARDDDKRAKAKAKTKTKTKE